MESNCPTTSVSKSLSEQRPSVLRSGKKDILGQYRFHHRVIVPTMEAPCKPAISPQGVRQLHITERDT